MKAILFDNYDGYDFEEIKSDLSEMYPDKEITDDMVWDEINNLEDIDNENMEMDLENIFGNNSGYRIGNGDILISILSDISTVGKNTGEGVLVETITS